MLCKIPIWGVQTFPQIATIWLLFESVGPSLQLQNMETAAAVTLLALILAMAGVSQALHIQGGGEKNDMLPGSSEESMANRLKGLVRQHIRGVNYLTCLFYCLMQNKATPLNRMSFLLSGELFWYLQMNKVECRKNSWTQIMSQYSVRVKHRLSVTLNWLKASQTEVMPMCSQSVASCGLEF